MRGVGWLCAMLMSAAVTVAACDSSSGGIGGSQVSCTRTESLPDGGPSLKMCHELTGSAQIAESVRQICMTDGGAQDTEHFASGPCSRDGALGGCRFTAGTT